MKSIVMEDELWMSLRKQALEENTSASEIIRRLVSKYLEKPQRKGGK